MSHQSRKRRRCAALPVDAWRQVASHLATSDISNLALVSKTCRAAALSPDLFAKHLHSQPPSDLLSTTDYETIYRHSKSLLYAPTTPVYSRGTNPGSVKIMGSVSKYIFLYNEKKGIVSCSPASWGRCISELLLNESETCLDSPDRTEAPSDKTTSFPTHEYVSERFLEMPDCKAGFLSARDKNGKRKLHTICAMTGETVEEVVLPMNEEDADIIIATGAEKQKIVLLGGVHSQYLVYYTQESFEVVLRKTGILVKTWPRMSENMLVRGETSFNAPLITGILKHNNSEHENLYHVYGLEGGSPEYNFSIDSKDQLIDVTRSRDGKTISKRISSDGSVKLWTVVLGDSIFHWHEALRGSNKSGVVEMRSNGSQVFTRPEGSDGRIIRFNYGSYVGVVKIARRIQGMSYDWARASWDGRVVVAVSRKGGFISMFDCEDGRCLASIGIGEELNDLILVDGHRLVGLTNKGFVERHFNRFCKCPPASEEHCKSGD